MPSTKKKIYKHSIKESQIQTKLIKQLHENYPGAFIVKLSDKWVSGLPDVMMIQNGFATFYEVKSDKGIVSPIQELTHKRLKASGATVHIVRGGDLN